MTYLRNYSNLLDNAPRKAETCRKLNTIISFSPNEVNFVGFNVCDWLRLFKLGLWSATVHKPGSPTARQHMRRKFIMNTYGHWYLYDPSWWMSNSPTVPGDTTTVKHKSLTNTNCRHERNTPHLITHVTQQIPMLFDFIFRATRIYEHAWHLLYRKDSFIIISQTTQRAIPTSYAVLLHTTHAQPQASNAQHPSYSHHYQNRNWAQVYGITEGRGDKRAQRSSNFCH